MRGAAIAGLAGALAAVPAAAEPACPARGVVADGAEPRTARALANALAERGVADRGTTWIGKLASVGGGERDTIVSVPAALDRTRPVDVIVFMDGVGSFAKRTMDRRHSAAIAAIAGAGANAVYVAPDAPTSARADDAAYGPYWRAGCARRRCGKDDEPPPGDFLALVADVTAKIDAACGGAATAAGYRLALVGFSGGGRGVREAIDQIARAPDDPRLAGVELRRVVFADATYASSWAREAWRRARDLATLDELQILVQAGELEADETEPGHASRWRAWKLVQAESERVARAVTWDGADAVVGKLRLRRVARCHHKLGDAAYEEALPARPGATRPPSAWSARDRAGTHRCRRGSKHRKDRDDDDGDDAVASGS
jgi:hypothetical protein